VSIEGTAIKFGDNVDTDVIIPARYLTTTDESFLAQHCFGDADTGFAQRVKPGDIIVAGSNFGCGSSREHAPLAIKGAGISCVIAPSFARIFFRNAFNIGLPLLESRDAANSIQEGDRLSVDIRAGEIRNLTKGSIFLAVPIPEFMLELIEEGGLVPYIRKRKLMEVPEWAV